MDKLKERDDWIIQQTGLCLVLLNAPMMSQSYRIDWHLFGWLHKSESGGYCA